ncbi:MAG: hypothetical protein M1826_007711, partial [Phylliscum demangeonii]
MPLITLLVRVQPPAANLAASRSIMHELGRAFNGEIKMYRSKRYQRTQPALPPNTDAVAILSTRGNAPLSPSPSSTTATIATTTYHITAQPLAHAQPRFGLKPHHHPFYGPFQPETRSFAAADLAARVPLPGLRDGFWGPRGRRPVEVPARIRRRWRQAE